MQVAPQRTQKDYWLGLGSTLLSSLQNPSGIWALHPVSGGVDWSTSGLIPPGRGPGFDLILMPEALGAVLERREMCGASLGPAGLRWKRSWQACHCLTRAYGVAFPRVPHHSICFSSFCYPALLMNTTLPQIMLMWPYGSKLVHETGVWGAWRRIRFTLSFRNSTAVSDSPFYFFRKLYFKGSANGYLILQDVFCLVHQTNKISNLNL